MQPQVIHECIDRKKTKKVFEKGTNFWLQWLTLTSYNKAISTYESSPVDACLLVATSSTKK